MLKGLSAFDISEWYIEYSAANANMSSLLGGETEFEALVGRLLMSANKEDETETLQELQALEQTLLYKLPLFTLGQVIYINEERVNLPNGITFGNAWYKYDMDFENWSIKTENN